MYNHIPSKKHILSVFVSACIHSLSCVRLFVTPSTVAYQAPLSMEFSKKEYWSWLPFPSPEDLPNQWWNQRLLHWQAHSSPQHHLGSPFVGLYTYVKSLNLLHFFSSYLQNNKGRLGKLEQINSKLGAKDRTRMKYYWVICLLFTCQTKSTIHTHTWTYTYVYNIYVYIGVCICIYVYMCVWEVGLTCNKDMCV